MAKIYGINGVLSGKVGNTIFASKGGKTIARQYQPIVRNPKTLPQVIQRARFLTANGLGQALANCLEGLSTISRGARVSLRNSFVRLNMENISASSSSVSQGTNVETEVSWPTLKVASGSGTLPSISSMTSEEAQQVQIEVDADNLPEGITASDFVVLVVVCPESNAALAARATISSGKVTMMVPNSWNGQRVWGYAFTVAALSNEVRERYVSLFNGGSITAYAELRNLASGLVYSNSRFVGGVTIS